MQATTPQLPAPPATVAPGPVPVVRRLQVDLKTPLQRHWCGGDAFRTALFNALSMSFPAGEQLFIDSVRMGVAALDDAAQLRWQDELAGFVGQEATHRHVHAQFNRHLTAQGLVNRWEARIAKRRARLLEPLQGVRRVRAHLGVTAATEHFTAVFAEWLLTHPQALDGAEPRLRDLWLWHSSEELEHRSTAFDLYRAAGGNELWRRRLFRIVSTHFAFDLLRQTLLNLWRDGTLLRIGTWRSAWRTLFARGGLLRESFGPWRAYLRSDFHPAQADGGPGERWLAEHGDLAPAVGAGR
jgi:predicted metal-dependent hydrolase